MKKYHILLLLLIESLVGHATLYDTPAFKLPQGNLIETSNFLKRLYISSDTTIQLSFDNPISGLAISGQTWLNNRDAIVRILLIDKAGREYLVFEDFNMYTNNGQHDFSTIAIETVVLDDILPKELKVFVDHAQVEISQIITAPINRNLSSEAKMGLRKDLLAAQEDYFIERWNQQNVENGQYWIAGKTSISGLPYSEKKKILGATCDHYLSDGIEYYVGGFFVVKAHGLDSTDTMQQDIPETRDVNSYVESFDWRNRHGKNWMTPVKNQAEPDNWASGNGGCWIFGPLAALESHTNLYYNRLLNIDLSEQEIGSCVIANASGHPSLHSGGYPEDTYNYILTHGIVNEECFPFQNDSTIPCATKCSSPLYTVNISSHYGSSSGTNQLKNVLINNGPVASGYCNGYTCHVMCLCGYGTITEGTHIAYAPQSASPNVDTIISAGSSLIGKTYWIYKNSYGANNPTEGYLYVVYENDNTRSYTRVLSYPVTLSTLTTNDIVCEDADNDGYYFWGLGDKPSTCPVCCPDIPDGDDSNPELAEMDNYGNFATYVFPYSTTTISSNTTWNSDTTHCGNIIVTNNAILTITAQLTMNPAAKIIIQNGGTLIVDTGSIINANIDVQTSAKIQLLHNGTLYLKQFGNLNVRLGAETNMEYGRVLLQ